MIPTSDRIRLMGEINENVRNFTYLGSRESIFFPSRD